MKILWLKTELLHPVDKGGRIRTYQMLKELKKQHEITYLTLDDGSAAPEAHEMAAEYCNRLLPIPHRVAPKFSGRFFVELAGNVASSLPYALEKYVSPRMREAIDSTVATDGYDVLVCDFLAPAVNVPPDLKIPTMLFQHNVEAMIWRRHFEVNASPLKKRFLKSQWRRMFEYEKQACRRFDRVVAVSREDVDTMRSDYGVNQVDDIPTGVDTAYFDAAAHGTKTGNKVVFTGSMDWLPNDDAMKWFLESIWPRVRDQVDDASLSIVGRSPSSSLKELAHRDPSTTITGRVPDVRPYMADAKVFVVPIRIGGGTRLKIYEAMAAGVPVVSTTIGAEGLPLKSDEEIVVRDAEGDFADSVVELLRQNGLAEKIAQAAKERVNRDFGWGTVAAEFTNQCQLAIGAWHRPEELFSPINVSRSAAVGS